MERCVYAQTLSGICAPSTHAFIVLFPFSVYLPFALHSTHVPDQTACLQGCPWCLPLEPAAARRR